MVVYAVDVGGSTLKHGDVAGATYAVSSNCVRVNAKQHTAQIRRPIERGYVVNWTLQGDIWQEALTVDPDATLLLTTPVFTPEKLLHTQDEVVFEEFHMAGMANVIPQAMVPLTLSSSSPVHVIVDVGFSATHIVPWIDGSIVWAGVRRLNVGGKLLTNYLKECVSFRQWNMMDSFDLINDVKEAVCRCSLEFDKDMKAYATSSGPSTTTSTTTASITPTHPTPLVQQWALPDFVHSYQGKLVTPTTDLPPHVQVLRVGVECFAVPEVLFHPSDIGIDQEGIAGGIADAIAACPPFVQGLMYQHIVVTGGSSKFPHFIDRLRVDLRPLVPAEYALHVTLHDDPVGAVWRGCQAFANTRTFKEEAVVTKEEYMEMGSAALYRWRNKAMTPTHEWKQ
ncbi:hypothetical protein H257_09954 [Aphanomyces astaci]|uniref:Actin-like protein ARP6 n=1 Tax=Aphanomyces astaci TaxID=112090 RepID=W4GAM4_APHAT|nr:hypothetical protein H257_09954 [Aphanomyces astaci]ETV76003.1 hypothetical protein H257_09954 [Aphanomyces astaci]|eukprot:XP_009834645.1 hypothetical protein H257_09954 [Aphanomyces astaci]